MELRVLGVDVAPGDAGGETTARQQTQSRAQVSRRALRIVALTGILDLLAVAVAYGIAKDVRLEWLGVIPLGRFDPRILATIPAWLVVFFAYGLYSRRLVIEPELGVVKLLNAIAMNMVMLVLTAFALHVTLSRGFIVVLWLVASTLVISDRLLIQVLISWLKRSRLLVQRALIVGVNAEAKTLARVLGRKPALGYEVLGFVGRSDLQRQVEGLPVLTNLAGLRQAGADLDVATVFVAGSSVGPAELAILDRELIGLSVRVRASLGVPHLAASKVVVDPVDGMAMMSFERRPPSASEVVLKRLIDVVLSLFGLVVAAPVMIAIAIAIKLTSHGPVVFAQQRVGTAGEVFTLYKFRTMVDKAEDLRAALEAANEAEGTLFKMRQDPRITPIGRQLRKLGLDELPQLVNILRGDMSLVGPRPALPSEAAAWTEEVAGRLRAKPGLTGLWQVSGRHELGFEDYVRYDLFYVENWSLGLDLRIVARTPAALLSRRGSY